MLSLIGKLTQTRCKMDVIKNSFDIPPQRMSVEKVAARFLLPRILNFERRQVSVTTSNGRKYTAVNFLV